MHCLSDHTLFMHIHTSKCMPSFATTTLSIRLICVAKAKWAWVLFVSRKQVSMRLICVAKAKWTWVLFVSRKQVSMRLICVAKAKWTWVLFVLWKQSKHEFYLCRESDVGVGCLHAHSLRHVHASLHKNDSESTPYERNNTRTCIASQPVQLAYALFAHTFMHRLMSTYALFMHIRIQSYINFLAEPTPCSCIHRHACITLQEW